MGGLVVGIVAGALLAVVLLAIGVPWPWPLAAVLGWSLAGLVVGALCEAAGRADEALALAVAVEAGKDVRCPECGNALPPGLNAFCDACGASLAAALRRQPPAASR